MDLVSFCHIRWNFVYQRPQHLLNRFAINNRVFVIEEPNYDKESNCYELKKDDQYNLWVVNFNISNDVPLNRRNEVLQELIDTFFLAEKIDQYILWYYSPMALKYSDQLNSAVTVYDCMDELSAFKFADPELKKMEKILLNKADIVFTGGQSLYEAKKDLHHNIHSFPSSIDKAHFKSARIAQSEPSDEAMIPHPRFGFYGVIDERFDIELLKGLAEKRPDWHWVLIGPIIKIDPAALPSNENIHYLGGKDYNDLPAYLSGWDVATLPFALNESTKFISPTKTPEYLAGGKKVISTSITDVVNPYGVEGLVYIADTVDDFIAAGEEILQNSDDKIWKIKVDNFLLNISWDETWNDMSSLIDQAIENKSIKTFKKSKAYV
ncbi:MAG: glycosyltransferase family 1 protein [Ginsengibacter sp.]